jgi:hypothetical protein
MFKGLLVPILIGAMLPAAALAAPATTLAAAPMMGSPMMGTMMMHGMPPGKAGADGIPYLGAPDLLAASSLVAAGGAAEHFSIVAALRSLAGKKIANAELVKLTRQYGPEKIASFVKVQNFAVDEAVRDATAAGVKFPAPTLSGTALAVRITKHGLEGGTYYEGAMLDKLVSHKIHEAVMDAIDAQYGAKADANYHRIADQAHYDLAQALGATSVKLALYH